MGATLSSEGGEEGVTVVSHGRPAAPDDGVALLRQLADLKHSLPLIPDPVTQESASAWSKALQRTAAPSSAGSSSSPPLPTALDSDLLEQLTSDYQRFSRWHCRRIVEKQERLNATIPLVEKQAVRLQQRLSDAARAAAAEQGALRAAADVQREAAAVAGRLAALQQSLIELEEDLALAGRQAGTQDGGGTT